MKKSSIICIVSGVVFLLVGLTALFSLPLVILRVIYSKLYLSPSNPSYNLWRDLPVPIQSEFYLFNVTNWHDVQSNGAKPDLQEVGPFVYRMTMRKGEPNITDGGDSIEFYETMAYYFDRDLSVDDDSVVVTSLNAPLAIAFSLIEKLPMPAKIAAIIAVGALRENFFVQKSVRELLFDGYTDLLTILAPIFNAQIPKQSKFAYMYGKNDTDDGLFRVNSGKRELKLTNSIETLNGIPHLPYWRDACASFTGATNGELFAPLSTNQETLLFFRTNFCRTWTMVWRSLEQLSSDFANLAVYRYHPANTTFANASDYPPNSCFAPKVTADDVGHVDVDSLIRAINRSVHDFYNHSAVANDFTQTLLREYHEYSSSNASNDAYAINRINGGTPAEFPSGIYSLSGCEFGTPLYLSYAHFLNADPVYLTHVNGLKPNATLHGTLLDVEPITGTSVQFIARLQLNAYVNPVVLYPKMPKIVFPVFWQGLNLRMSKSVAEQVKWSVSVPAMIATIISSIFVATGVVLLLVSISGPLWRRLKPTTSERTAITTHKSETSDDREKLIKDSEDSIEDTEAAPTPDDNDNNNVEVI